MRRYHITHTFQVEERWQVKITNQWIQKCHLMHELYGNPYLSRLGHWGVHYLMMYSATLRNPRVALCARTVLAAY